MRTIARASLVLVIAGAIVAPRAFAAQYPGRADTGWVYASKRDCCDAAIAMAQEYSATACREIGGVPAPMHGGVQRRGFCEWHATQDASGTPLFRCLAEATIPCR